MKNTLEWRDGKCYEIKPDGSEVLIHNPNYESESVKEDTAERAKSYITKYEKWLKDQTAMEEESKAKAAKTATNIETWRKRLKDKSAREKTEPEGKKYNGAKLYDHDSHEPCTYMPYQEVRIYHNIDRVRWRHTWMWLVKFYHNENFHKDTRWESDYGPNKKYKTWLEHQEALRAKTQGSN